MPADIHYGSLRRPRQEKHQGSSAGVGLSDEHQAAAVQLGPEGLVRWHESGWLENAGTPTAGFVAQELDEAQTNARAEWLNLVLKSTPDRLEATPGNLLPVVVKAIQDLKNENDLLKAEIVALKQSLTKVVKEEIARVPSQSQQTEISLNER